MDCTVRGIPIAVSIEDKKTCSRCGKVFEPPANAQEGTATFYRCALCLSAKTIAKDYVYSTCILS